MSIDIFKSCTQTPKSGKIFWKSRGILKSRSAGDPANISGFFCGPVWKLSILFIHVWLHVSVGVKKCMLILFYIVQAKTY